MSSPVGLLPHEGADAGDTSATSGDNGAAFLGLHDDAGHADLVLLKVRLRVRTRTACCIRSDCSMCGVCVLLGCGLTAWLNMWALVFFGRPLSSAFVSSGSKWNA